MGKLFQICFLKYSNFEGNPWTTEFFEANQSKQESLMSFSEFEWISLNLTQPASQTELHHSFSKLDPANLFQATENIE
jgi:hypothetical protein